jgi:hypothetical protein
LLGGTGGASSGLGGLGSGGSLITLLNNLGVSIGIGGVAAAGGSAALAGGGTAAGIYATGAGGTAGVAGIATGSQIGTGIGAGAGLGTIAGGLGAGVAVGLVTNYLLTQALHAIGIEGRAGGTLAGIGAGAAGGAVAGSIIPGVGTVVGAIVGAIIGGIAGYLSSAQQKPPQLDIFRVQSAQVGFDPRSGQLMQTQLFEVLDAFARRIKDFQHTLLPLIDQQINKLVQGVVQGFTGVDPAIADKLVAPLNAIFDQVSQTLTIVHDKGSAVAKDIQKMLTTDLPAMLNGLIQPLKDAVSKLDPVIKDFRTIITSAQQTLDKLKQEQAQQNIAFAQDILTIQQGLFTPQQAYAQLWKNLQAGIALLAGTGGQGTAGGGAWAGGTPTGFATAGTAATMSDLQGMVQQIKDTMNNKNLSDVERAALIPELQKLVMQIWEAAKAMQSAGNTFDQISQGLITPAEKFQDLKGQLADLLTQFQGATGQTRQDLASQIETIVQQIWTQAQQTGVLGQDPQALRDLQAKLLNDLRLIGLGPSTTGGTTGLSTLQGQLVQILQQLQDAGNQNAASMQATVQTQIDKAQEQIVLLAASLNDLNSVDATITTALGVLQDINDALAPLGGTQVSLDTQGIQLRLLAAQAQSLGNLESIQTNAAMNLQAISMKLTSHFVPFQHGTPYVPHDMLAMVHQGERIIPAAQNAHLMTMMHRSYQAGTPYVPQDMWAFLHQGERITPAARNTGDQSPIVIQVQGRGITQLDLEQVAVAVQTRLDRRQRREALR